MDAPYSYRSPYFSNWYDESPLNTSAEFFAQDHEIIASTPEPLKLLRRSLSVGNFHSSPSTQVINLQEVTEQNDRHRSAEKCSPRKNINMLLKKKCSQPDLSKRIEVQNKVATNSTPKKLTINVRSTAANISKTQASVSNFKSDHVAAMGMPKSPGRTVVKPFSFEKRDMEMLLKKREKLRRVMAAEAQCRQFHAKPMPKFLNNTQIPGDHTFSRPMSGSKDAYMTVATFKARDPTVLNKKPFVPIKPPRSVVHVLEFELNTEKRAEKWQETERIKKEKEAIMNQFRQENAAFLKKKEEESIRRLRQELVHKPLPLRIFKPYNIKQSEKSLVHPKTPVCFKKLSKSCVLNSILEIDTRKK